MPEAAVTLNFRNAGVVATARGLRGRFQSIQVEVKAAHEAMATRLQEYELEALQESIEETGRPQRKTRYLEEAIIAEGNREVGFDGFVVGVESFLDSSRAAPYYRHLESGYTGFVGRELRGFFKTGDATFAPLASRYRRDIEMIQTGATVGGHKGNTISLGNLQHQEGKQKGRLKVRSAEETVLSTQHATTHTSAFTGHTVPSHNTGKPGHPAPTRTRTTEFTPATTDHGSGFKIVIKNPIPAYEYIARGIQRWESAGIELLEYQRALSKFEGLVKFTTEKGNVGAHR